MLLWLQKKAKDHQGAVLVTGLDCGPQISPQWCICGYMGRLRGTRALRMASV